MFIRQHQNNSQMLLHLEARIKTNFTANNSVSEKKKLREKKKFIFGATQNH